MRLGPEEGSRLVKLARASIEGKKLDFEGLEERRGVFVTINSYPSGGLRGCIGFPQPIKPLGTAIAEAARFAAYSDSRFEPLGKGEQVTVEVSVLTVPEFIQGNVLKSFTVGRHGLIAECRRDYGLLLPQVFVEWKATPLKALQMVCEKAGLSPDAWKGKDCKIYKFEAQVFKEKSPDGKVVEA